MILVATNVWSELTRPSPEPRVRSWGSADASKLYLATVVIGELLSGAYLLPEGRRKQSFLESHAEPIDLHADRVVPFDLGAAKHFGPILAAQEKAGRNPGTADTQMAASARSRRIALATRNVEHFAGLGIELIDPWQA